MNFVKYILVPCPEDLQGNYSTTNFCTPYGYHHIVGLTPGGVGIMVATVSGEWSPKAAEEAMKVLARDTPTEIGPDFYKNKKI